MGEIIEFRKRIKKLDTGAELYHRYYENAANIDKWYIRETAALNMYNNSYKKTGFWKLKQFMQEEDIISLLGHCAAWYLTRGIKESDCYVRKMYELKRKYGMEEKHLCQS